MRLNKQILGFNLNLDIEIGRVHFGFNERLTTCKYCHGTGVEFARLEPDKPKVMMKCHACNGKQLVWSLFR